MAALTAGHLVNDFYTMMLPPLIPALKAAFALNYLEVGVLSFCFTILAGLLQPSAGHLADRHAARKRIIVAGFLVFSLGFAGMSLAESYGALLVACLVCSVGAATFHPQSTNLLTRAFPSAKGRAMGIHGWGGSFGNFLAPVVVAYLVSVVGWRQGVIWLAIPGLVAALFLGRTLNEPSDVKIVGFVQGITRPLVLLSVAFALLSMVLRGFLTFLPTFLVERGASLAQAGLITSLMLFVGLVAQPLGGQVYDRLGGRTIFVACAIGTGLSLLGFTISRGPMLVVWAAGVGFFIFALFPVSLAMGSEVARGERVGVSVGLIFGISSTLSAFAPIFTGHVADLVGLNVSFQLLVVLAALAALLSLSLPERRVPVPVSGEARTVPIPD